VYLCKLMRDRELGVITRELVVRCTTHGCNLLELFFGVGVSEYSSSQTLFRLEMEEHRITLHCIALHWTVAE